jgi:bifunctional non-homologous end joining protein LigD
MPRTTRTREPDGPVAVAGVTISHHDRVLYPEAKLTKADVARYFERIAEHVLPHVADRPLTVVRCPQGLAGSCFFQKHVAQTLPPPVRQHRVAGDPAPWLGVDDVPGLVTLVQFGVLELHPWNSRADDPERPDRIVIDLDPGPDVERARVAAAARGVRDLLTALGLVSFARTTGGKGLHVVVPIRPQASWDEVKAFSRDLVAALATTAPDDFVLTATKAKRRGRIFLDYLRNARGATAVASYSPRARPGAPVAMPIAWRDVDGDLDPMAFTVLTVPRLLARGADPWRDFFRTKQSLTAAMRAAVGRL